MPSGPSARLRPTPRPSTARPPDSSWTVIIETAVIAGWRTCVEACPSGLTPMARQLAALVTSVLNEPPHCSSGLLLKLESLGADRRFPDHVATDPRTTRSGDPRLDAIMEYAVKLTLTPGEVSQQDVDALRTHGLEDLDILDLNNMVAYYCYTNRVANGLGLKTTIDSAREATLALPV